jgi:hypothetical protein
MKRYAITTTLAAALASFAAVGVASAHKQPQPHPNKVRALIHTTDNGCSGQEWANDTITRTLKVHRNKDGSYRIREEDKGSFQTNAGGTTASPGNCPANKSKHGHTVRAGVVGTLKGYIKGTVTGGTFDPKGSCSDPCTQSAFIAAYFGPDATFSCRTNSRDCKFKWVYHAKKNQNLLFRHWEDRGKGAGTFLKERFKGDIADA